MTVEVTYLTWTGNNLLRQVVRVRRTASSQQPNKCQKKSPAVRRDQSRDCGAVWAPIRLWSLTLGLWWDGPTNRALQAFLEEYVLESSSSLAHLGNSPEG